MPFKRSYKCAIYINNADRANIKSVPANAHWKLTAALCANFTETF